MDEAESGTLITPELFFQGKKKFVDYFEEPPSHQKIFFVPTKVFFSWKKPKNGKTEKGSFFGPFLTPPKKVEKGGLFPVSCRFLTKGWDYRFLKGGGGWGYFRSILRGGGPKGGQKRGCFWTLFATFSKPPKTKNLRIYPPKNFFKDKNFLVGSPGTKNYLDQGKTILRKSNWKTMASIPALSYWTLE